MIGQYTEAEMLSMSGLHMDKFQEGLILRVIGSTYNYYRKESDGSWTNYNCKTVYKTWGYE